MADATVTAANVAASANARKTSNKVAGATITAGQIVYCDAADSNKIKPADSSTVEKAAAVGIALHGSMDTQPIDYVTEDDAFNPGFAVTVGGVYGLSDTADAGAFCPVADLLTGDFVTVVGLGVTASTIKCLFNAKNQSGVALL